MISYKDYYKRRLVEAIARENNLLNEASKGGGIFKWFGKGKSTPDMAPARRPRGPRDPSDVYPGGKYYNPNEGEIDTGIGDPFYRPTLQEMDPGLRKFIPSDVPGDTIIHPGPHGGYIYQHPRGQFHYLSPNGGRPMPYPKGFDPLQAAPALGAPILYDENGNPVYMTPDGPQTVAPDYELDPNFVGPPSHLMNASRSTM